MTEFALIQAIRQRATTTRKDVVVGIGDDAAVLRVPRGGDLVVAMDTLVEGVHFEVGARAQDIGWKALAANLSDLAAMGAAPAWATMALTLPKADKRWVGRLADGFADLARRYKVALVGGDTTRGPLTVTVQAHGFVPVGESMRRAGARLGDLIYVSGTIGDAAAALTLVDSEEKSRRADRRILNLRLTRPEPRLLLGHAVRRYASACIDISDGLVADLGHLVAASKVGADINAADIPTSTAFMRCIESPEERLKLQLTGGDDYELAFTISENKREQVEKLAKSSKTPITCIGRICARSGVQVKGIDGKRLKLDTKGWDHFKNA